MQNLSRGWLDTEPIIHSVSESLVASEVLFRRPHGYMTQQELERIGLSHDNIYMDTQQL